MEGGVCMLPTGNCSRHGAVTEGGRKEGMRDQAGQ